MQRLCSVLNSNQLVFDPLYTVYRGYIMRNRFNTLCSLMYRSLYFCVSLKKIWDRKTLLFLSRDFNN